MIEQIKNISIDKAESLLNFTRTNIQVYSIFIDCENLKDYNSIDIRKSIEYKQVFDNLNDIKNYPVLYWFEIENTNIEAKQIVNAINEYSKSGNKAVPAIKKSYEPNSKILYVGKVKRNFNGRLIQHLGFYKINNTQGLQLFYWAGKIKLKLKLNYIVFDNSLENLMPLFEIEIAKKIKPIVGKMR